MEVKVVEAGVRVYLGGLYTVIGDIISMFDACTFFYILRQWLESYKSTTCR